MNKNNKLVSINLTTYNRCKLLKRSLNSILNQSYNNIEIIIIDDASNDDTKKIVKEFLKKDKRIKYFCHKKNMGLSVARNTGIKNSSGEYICTFDDDDEWIDIDKIKKQVKIFKNDLFERIGFIYTGVNLISRNKITKPNLILPSNFKKHILMRNGLFCTSTIMYKKKTLEKIKGFDINLKRGIDSDVQRRIILKLNLKPFFIKDITTNVYEMGSDRITMQNTKHKLKNSIQTQKYLIIKNRHYLYKYPSALIYRNLRLFKTYFNLYIKIKK